MCPMTISWCGEHVLGSLETTRYYHNLSTWLVTHGHYGKASSLTSEAMIKWTTSLDSLSWKLHLDKFKLPRHHFILTKTDFFSFWASLLDRTWIYCSLLFTTPFSSSEVNMVCTLCISFISVNSSPQISDTKFGLNTFTTVSLSNWKFALSFVLHVTELSLIWHLFTLLM